MYSALKSSGTVCEFDNLSISSKFMTYHGIQPVLYIYSLFYTTLDTGYQTIWIKDQTPRFMGPDLDLDPYCLQKPIRPTDFEKITEKYSFYSRTSGGHCILKNTPLSPPICWTDKCWHPHAVLLSLNRNENAILSLLFHLTCVLINNVSCVAMFL